MSPITILDWKLVRLSLDQIGPFQEAIRTFDFMDVAPPEDQSRAPSNLFMLLAKNGHGKTTVLETLHGLMGLMAEPPVGRFVDPDEKGRAQADFRVRWRQDRQERTVILSIWTGSVDPILTPDDVRLDGVDAQTHWERLSIGRGPGGPVLLDGSSNEGLQLYRQIRAELDRAPSALLGASQLLPTILFFPADRAVYSPKGAQSVERPRRWGYAPAQTFLGDGPEWRDSIDNLLVWLDWLGDGRLDDLLNFVNPKLFATDQKFLLPPDRETLMTAVQTPNGRHALSGLSHGERALLQLFVRVACHMTGNTIVLIDEIETHLHTKYMNRMFQALKALAIADPRLSIVFSTHNRELIQVFDHKRREPGIIKGGELIEDELH